MSSQFGQLFRPESAVPVEQAGSAKALLFTTVLGGLKNGLTYISRGSILAGAGKAGITINGRVLSVYLHQAVKQGIIYDAGRGWYSRLNEPVKIDAQPVAKLIKAVEKAFPLLDFTVWSTAQINPWMHHLLAQPVAFLHAEADALASIGEALLARGWEVAVNPKPSVGPASVRPGGRMVILRPSLSKQPAGKGRQAVIEKILVDLVAEASRLSLMDNSEAQGVATAILGRHLVQIALLQRYADSRAVAIDELEAINQRQSTAAIGDS